MQHQTPNKSQIDNSIYDALGDRWYTAFDDPVAMLRAESRVKIPWVLERMAKYFSQPGAVRCLDVGCGAGFLTNHLAMVGYAITGLDLSEESLGVAKKYDQTKKVNYICGDAYNLQFPDNSFDVVTSIH